ncbi:hypothetical protein [uncultured Eubacterium sp.]|uniref:hypothetical protein n=1 Tax=uncultured Eubacterium sp. TaxID=165185 RepID=UPI0025951289|nr:hypothetical protein [uncultured Eubacterium sp.]
MKKLQTAIICTTVILVTLVVTSCQKKTTNRLEVKSGDEKINVIEGDHDFKTILKDKMLSDLKYVKNGDKKKNYSFVIRGDAAVLNKK